jgi:succinate dehydrogenase / fumarate reductase membrane anchor subunit
MVNRIVVGAHYGLRDWLIQRITAIYMAIYLVFFLLQLLVASPLDYATWKWLFGWEAMKIFTLMFFVSLFLHAWVGVRDIFMDYIKPLWLRLGLQVLTILALLVYGVWTVSILWSV